MSDAERCVVCGEVIQEWALEDAVKKPNAFSKTPEETMSSGTLPSVRRMGRSLMGWEGGKRMARYIDAYFAQQIADAELGSSGKETVQWVLAHTPNADVQEVRHGKWGNYESYSDGYRCSCCKLINRNCTRYCPHCGAKMDGEMLRDDKV